ncbi:50S ribosomal protein L11 methyltransferase [Streptomyces sp. NPDC089919]|uniref:50S ribosomal protein L11 methyltransferase n=1 Tax=Streptomyces sp. NPDC089919 TaxID=3155188 RepID=UPI00344A1FBB
MFGSEWDLLDDVFAPPFSRSTGVAMELLGLGSERSPQKGSFLEIGCGTGVVAVTAAMLGCDRVVAADINPEAVRNTALNARRHQVEDRLRAVHSNVFDDLDPQERFDVVYWHSNFVLGPEDLTYESVHDQAYVDAGYRSHTRYLAGATDRLAPGGRALLHFSDRGDIPRLHELAHRLGRELHMVAGRADRDGEETIAHILYEVRATA